MVVVVGEGWGIGVHGGGCGVWDGNFDIIFGLLFPTIIVLPCCTGRAAYSTYSGCCSTVSAHAYWVLIDACDLMAMVCSIRVSRALGHSSGWLRSEASRFVRPTTIRPRSDHGLSLPPSCLHHSIIDRSHALLACRSALTL